MRRPDELQLCSTGAPSPLRRDTRAEIVDRRLFVMSPCPLPPRDGQPAVGLSVRGHPELSVSEHVRRGGTHHQPVGVTAADLRRRVQVTVQTVARQRRKRLSNTLAECYSLPT